MNPQTVMALALQIYSVFSDEFEVQTENNHGFLMDFLASFAGGIPNDSEVKAGS